MKRFCILLFSLIISTSLNSMEESTDNVQKSTWYLEATFNNPSYIRAVTLDTLGDRLAMSAYDKIHIFKINTQEALDTFNVDNQKTTGAVCFNHQGNQIATGSNNTKAYTIDLITKEKSYLITKEKSSPYNNNKKPIQAIASNQTGDLLAVAAGNTARIFNINLPKQKPIASFHHSNPIVALCFDSANTHLITATAGASASRIRVFDLNTKQKIHSFKRPRYVFSVLCNAQEEILTVENNGSILDTMHIFNATTNQTIDTQIKINRDLFSVHLNPNTQQLALGLFGEARVYTQHIKPISALWALKNFIHDGKPLLPEVIYHLVKFMLPTSITNQ